MAKKVTGVVRLQIPAGAANPAPPVGPALGQAGVNIMQFCKAFNAATQAQSGLVIPVVITVYQDCSFTFITKSPPAAELLKAATVGSARAMGLTDCDVLSEGRQADMIVIDMKAANLQPAHHIPESLVLSGDRMNVKMTVCAGKILYENGVYTNGIDADAVRRDCASRIARLTP